MRKGLSKHPTTSPESPADLRKFRMYTELRLQTIEERRMHLFGVAVACPHNDKSCPNQTLQRLRRLSKAQLHEAIKRLSDAEVTRADDEHLDCSCRKELGER